MLEMLKKNKEIFVICVLYGIILLAVFIFIIGGNVPPSADNYDKIAQHLLSDTFFTSNGVSADYIRTPGYPFFLIAIYFLGGNNATVVIVQIFLTVINVYLFYRILIMMNIPKRLTLFGTVLFLCYFYTITCTFTIFTETLFGFFLMLSLYFLIFYFKNGKNPMAFLTFSISLNYALLVRPILMYFNMLVCLALLIVFIIKKIQLKCFVLFTLCFALVFGGWSYRNYLHSGVFVFSTILKINTQRYYTPIITARIKNIKAPIGGFIEGATDYHEEMFLQEYPEVKGGNLNDAQIAILRGKYGSQFIKNNFSEYIKANIAGFFRMMLHPGFGGGRSQFIIQSSIIIKYMNIGLSLLSLAYIVIVYLIYLAGLVTVFKKHDVIHICIFLLCGYLAIPGAIFGNPRFRNPFFPLLLLSAVSNSGVIIQWLSQKLRIPALYRIEKFLLHETETSSND